MRDGAPPLSLLTLAQMLPGWLVVVAEPRCGPLDATGVSERYSLLRIGFREGTTFLEAGQYITLIVAADPAASNEPH